MISATLKIVTNIMFIFNWIWLRIRVLLFISIIFICSFIFIGVVMWGLSWFADTVGMSNEFLYFFAELFLFVSIFLGFFYALFKSFKSMHRSLWYCYFLLYVFIIYWFLSWWVFFYQIQVLEEGEVFYFFNYTLQVHVWILAIKGFILLFYLLVSGALILDMFHNSYRVLELPFFIGLLFWFFF